jgi:serine/threonine protein kinase/tetratricopeptide (TPR) repeat protein
MPVDLSHAKQIFLDALDQLPNLREEFIRRRCAGDEPLRQRVMSLMAAHTQPDEVLDRTSPVATMVRTGDDSVGSPGWIGQYELIRVLGQGGFGVVWLAQQHAPLSRKVALKLLHPALVGFAATPSAARELIARFDTERQALASMDHPNIARVLDAGSVEEGPHKGQPYFVMEFVDGPQIVRFCDHGALGVRPRLELFMSVCMAVQHAHQKGVIHRDLKPSNVLIAQVDGRPMSKVIDFGVAKAVGESRHAPADLTQQMHVIGTPQYMSPEQAVPGGALVDTRSDVYMLGALLYELLSGAAPIDAATLREAALDELCRLVREQVPPRPSARASPFASQLRGELDWIVMKALEKEPSRRYQSAADLARDLDRHLRNEPVSAGPPSAMYRARKFVRRHRAGVVAASLVGVAMLTATVVSLMQAARARRAERDAIAQADRARAAERAAVEQAEQARRELAKYTSIARFSQQIITSIDPQVARGRDRTLLREVLSSASTRADAMLGDQPEVAYAIHNTLGYAFFAIGDSQKALRHNLQAYALAEKLYGPDDVQTLHALGNVLPMYTDTAQHDKAEQTGLKLLAAFERTGKTDTHEALVCMSNLASLYLKLNRPREALALMERAVEGRRKLDGEGPRSFASMNNLAMTYDDLGELNKAQQLWEHLLTLQRQHLGNDHPQTLGTLNNLASVADKLGDSQSAQSYYRQALEGKRRVLSAGHPSRLVTEINFANFLVGSGKLDEAAVIFEQAYADSLKSVGPDDERRITLTMWVGELRRLAGRLDESLPLLEDAWQRFRKQFGDTDARTLQAATNRLALACDMGNRGDAQRVLETLRPVLEGQPIASPGVESNLFYTAARAALAGGERDVARRHVAAARRAAQSLPTHLPLHGRIARLSAELETATTRP